LVNYTVGIAFLSSSTITVKSILQKSLRYAEDFNPMFQKIIEMYMEIICDELATSTHKYIDISFSLPSCSEYVCCLDVKMHTRREADRKTE
jgi:hypothetical protein